MPDPDVGSNLQKAELLAQLAAVHERIATALPKLDAKRLAQPHPVEPIRKFFPMVGDQLVYSMTAHEMDHLGQLAAWRRALGLPPAM